MLQGFLVKSEKLGVVRTEKRCLWHLRKEVRVLPSSFLPRKDPQQEPPGTNVSYAAVEKRGLVIKFIPHKDYSVLSSQRKNKIDYYRL